MAPNKFIILSFICLLFITNYSKAQYADIGTGNLRNQLWWFNWNGFKIQEGASRTFTSTDGLTVQITFTGVSGQLLNPSVMDTWSGALLYNLYNFSNTAIQPALYALNTNSPFNSKCTLQITASRNGIPAPFTLITADAEASDPNYENTTLTTSGTQWTTVDFFRNSTQTANPLTGCGTDTVIMTDTYAGTVGLGQIPILATNVTTGNTLKIGVNLQENAPTGGGMSLAFGIIAAVDHGHLPASYGDAFHAINYTAINGCSYNPPFPTLVQNANIILGSTPPYPLVSDTVYLNKTDPDDDGVLVFPQYTGNGNYSLSVKVKNISGNPAYLSAWFDYNNDGIFETNERIVNTIKNNDTVALVQWTGLPAALPSAKLAFRFRLSSDSLAVQSNAGFAKDGEVEDYMEQVMGNGITCGNNWLYNTAENSGVQIGKLNVPGNTITVEALINRTTPYVGGRLYAGDIVSKHHDATDINYLLRPSSAEITTTNGYFITPPVCDIDLNKVYHVAMVYDGQFLKFYRNGFLMSQVSCTGNMFINNYITTIGEYATYPAPLPEMFVGYINEVRIWNVARTQDQIRSNMNSPLPAPSTQQGLLGYFSFNSLQNLQGNSLYNGNLFGTANIQNSNPACKGFIVDSCAIITTPVLTVSNDTAVCAGKSANLVANAPNSFEYTWYPALGLSDSTVSNPVASPKVTTLYHITVQAYASDGTIVTLTDSVLIQVLSLPVVTTIADTAVCLGDSLFLQTSGASAYQWSNISGLSSYTINNPVAKPQNTSKYKVTGTDKSGCTNEDSVIITVLPLPVVNISNDTSICAGNTLRLSASGGVSYQWQPVSGITHPDSSSIQVTPAATTQYMVTIMNNNSCTASDSVLVKVIAHPFFSLQPQSTELCVGDSVELIASGGDSYRWLNPANNSSQQKIFVKPNSSSLYSVQITNNVCHITDTLLSSIQVNPLPVVTVSKSNDLDCFTGTAMLTATGGATYSWTPAYGLSDTVIANPQVQISQSTLYTVSVTTSKGCMAKDTITVNVFSNSNNPYLVANAFTPNGDGKNDCFGIKDWGVINSFELDIFNRWGQKIFTTNNPSGCWDGTFNGIQQPIGGYVYMIRAATFCGTIERTGTLVLIR